MQEALEQLPDEFDHDGVLWVEQAMALVERCERELDNAEVDAP
jgi:exonuclease VII small subunit